MVTFLLGMYCSDELVRVCSTANIKALRGS